ncbi:MAG TPA: hypothetical protein VI072_20740 [Polyangiaceae bacterium]
MTPRARLFAKIITLLVSLVFVACKPEIGDECELSTDCSATGDRLCDLTQPGGYCTMFNCEPGSCPEEAVCIGYGNVLASAPACQDPQASRRLQRTFCLKSCDSDDDCRGGYDCVDMKRYGERGVVVVERAGKSGKVCAVPISSEQPDLDRASDVCTGRSDGGARPETDAGDAAIDGDADGGSSEGGDAGSADASDGSDAESADASADALVD